MNTAAIAKSEIIQELSRIPEEELYIVKRYIDSILEKYPKPLSDQSLKGIWKDVGFEKLIDLEKDVRDVRRELQEIILNRTV
ncbi:hypothetical protein U14_04404 [Candidatus Moduliflexus flocculans]|uniref:Uncharacterized protein n=1 Tax=Candidatus Moduliflexus flocculans TaxID=1499966 RepID=A0A0S6W0G1_9BACT|nr:hypothetical protein U14_04404 [Candidatus Moduliflexus flocculans]